MPVVVSDTSPLIYLTRLGHFDWLRQFYSYVFIPTAVWDELNHQGASYPEAKETQGAVLSGWMKVRKPERPIAGYSELDLGEREAIALAKELGAMLLIDEAEGRQAARRLGIPVTGTLDLLIEAKRRGLILKVGDELACLTKETTFRISDELRTAVLQQAGEVDSRQ